MDEAPGEAKGRLALAPGPPEGAKIEAKIKQIGKFAAASCVFLGKVRLYG